MSDPYASFSTIDQDDDPYASFSTLSPDQDVAAPAQGFLPTDHGGKSQSFLDAVGYSVADAATFGIGDELIGAIEGAGAALSGEDYLDAYRKRVDAARERLEVARLERPGASMLGSLVGSVPWAFGAGALTKGVPALAALAEQGAGRGLPALAAQMKLGALAGVAGGAAYGVGSSDGDLGERLGDAVAPTIAGGVIGGAAPAVLTPIFNTAEKAVLGNPLVKPVFDKAGAALNRLTGKTSREAAEATANAAANATVPPLRDLPDAPMPTPQFADPSTPSMAIDPSAPQGPGGLPPQGAETPPVELPKSVVKDVDRLLGREQYGVDELQKRVAAVNGLPMDQTLADIGGQQFLAKADSLANAPGTTGPAAFKLAEERAKNLPTQIEDDLKNLLKVRQSPSEAKAALENSMENIGKDYRQLFARVQPNRQIVERGLKPIIEDDPLFQDALERTARIQQREIRLHKERGRPKPAPDIYRDLDEKTGRPVGPWKLNPNASGETLHRLKIAFDEAVGAGARRTDASSIEKFEALEVAGKGEDSLRSIFLKYLDEAIPGYKDVRAVAGGLFEAEDALKMGAAAFSKNASAIRAEMQGMTPFEKRHFRIAFADKVIDSVMRGSGPVGNRNAANVLNNNKLQLAMREVFDSPEQAEAFLTTLNRRNELLRNATGMAGNSKTAQRLMQQGDQLMAAMTDAGVDVATGNPGGVVSRIGRGAFDAVRGGAVEKRNNALGDVLLKRLDDGDAQTRALMEELFKQLREIEHDRARRASAAAFDGLTAGQIAPDLFGNFGSGREDIY